MAKQKKKGQRRDERAPSRADEPRQHEDVYGDIYIDRDLEELERQAGELSAGGRHDVERVLGDQKRRS